MTEDAGAAVKRTDDTQSEADYQARAAPHITTDEIESPEHLLGDFRLRNALAARGFEGPEYDLFEEQLSAYSISVMVNWVRSKRIIEMCARRRVPGTRTMSRMAALHWPDYHESEDVALTTVAKALPTFRKIGLVEGGWRPERGASLTTYFTGTCMFVFPDVYRTWRESRQRRVSGEENATPSNNHLNTDPAHIVIAREELRERLPQDSRSRTVLLLNAEGYRTTEIAQILGITERSIDGILYRFRSANRTRRTGGGPR